MATDARTPNPSNPHPWKPAEEITVGDTIRLGSVSALPVVKIEAPTDTDPDWVIGRAKGSDGQGMTLTAGAQIAVL